MILPKHPRAMAEDELCKHVKALIERQTPESSFLDYKAEISIKGRTKRIEIAKDVTSFANEAGGTLLYGVPEIEIDGIPVPRSVPECGIEIPDGLPSDLENILLDIVRPSLSELFIKILRIEELRPKSLLMIYHPESWNKPHMVERYAHGRYYRRGNYRAIVMTERQIEAAYSARRASITHAEHFFKTPDFRTIPKAGRFLRMVMCPHIFLVRKEEMLEQQFRKWLSDNPPGRRPGDWIPFLDGSSFQGHPSGNFYGKQYEFRLFHNGAICFNMDLDLAIDQENLILNLKGMEKVFRETILPYATKALEFLGVTGPLSTQVNLHNVRKLRAGFPRNHFPFNEPDIGPTTLQTDSITFVEEMSVDELRFQSNNVLKRLLRRLASAFGIWRA